MTIKFIIPLLILLLSCGSRPDSSGKIYDINSDLAIKQMYSYLNDLIEDDDEHHEAFYRRSKLYFEDKKFTKALDDINQAIKLSSRNQTYLIHQAKVYAAFNNHHKVYRILSQIDDQSKTTELLKLELIAGVKTGNLKNPKAITEAMQGVNLQHGQEDYLLGMLAWDKGDTAETKKKLESAYRYGEKGEDVLLTLAKAYSTSNEAKSTALLFEAAVKYESKHTRILLANNFIRSNQAEREDSLYGVLLKSNPTDYEVVLRRARLYQTQGKYIEIINMLKNKFEKTKTMEDDFILADAYFSLKKNDEASKMYVLLEPLDTTGQITKNTAIIKWRKKQEILRNLPDSLRTISKDSVNSSLKITQKND